jgi:hypothetical protein
MKITPEQRTSWVQRTAESPFNKWLSDKTRGADGRFDLEKLHVLAGDYGIDKRSEYEGLNPGQQRMNIGNALRSRVPADFYAAYEVRDYSDPKIFGTWFWGFDPILHPFAGFTHRGSLDTLILKARQGDLILVVGTQKEPTTFEDRGRALGLIEFLPTPMQAEDLIPPGAVLPDRLFENGVFKWPHAVPAARAWRFTSKPHIRDLIGRQLTSAAITGIDLLSDVEAAAVLGLEAIEIELPISAAQLKQERLHLPSTKPDPSKPGQPGPPPSEWSSIISRQDGPTATYLMQFGRENVWKIGISQNVKERCKTLNFAVPSEVLDGRNWRVVLTQNWPNGAPAYLMEQALLNALAPYATQNERVKVHEGVVLRAWQEYLLGRL